jgi:hypothetical protein
MEQTWLEGHEESLTTLSHSYSGRWDGLQLNGSADWAARRIKKILLDENPAAVIAVWGLAYKENTHSTKNSPSLATIEQLGSAKLRLHDPVVRISKEKMFDKVAGFIKKMGIDISAGKNIRFDLEARESKSPRAFCSPVRIPDEVYLVIYPKGGEEDYTAFLHELGHALHFANVKSSLEFEYKWCGDNSVTEGYAMTFDHFTMNETWMDINMDINKKNNREYFIHKAMNELIMLRRFAAKIHYEIMLNESDGLQGKKELYSEIFEKATKVKYSPEYYLLDVDQYFYCARYLRAWMFQANMNEYLNNKYGSDWFENKNTGKFFMDVWSMGQKYNAEELSEMNGDSKLSINSVLDSINSVLLN